jgi:hypothetical protein
MWVFIVGVLTVLVIMYTLIVYSGPYTITGKISRITFVETKLDTGFTEVTFDDGGGISFSGDLGFQVGGTYTFTYHKYGLLWKLFGGESVNVVDRAALIGK